MMKRGRRREKVEGGEEEDNPIVKWLWCRCWWW